MDGHADGGHLAAAVDAAALRVHLSVYMDMGNEAVDQMHQEQPYQEKEIGIGKPEASFRAAEKVDEAHIDHHPCGKAQAQG